MTALRDKQAWIFDLDGTLTEPVHDFAHIRQALGMAPEADILATIAAQPEPIRRTTMKRLDELERHYAAQARPAMGLLPCLQRLQAQGCRLGILTRNSRELALLSLDAIGAAQFFDPKDVLGRDEVDPKPAPDGIKYLLNQWDIGFRKAVMVGDFHFDLLSGRAAGVTTVHVDPADRHWPEVTDYRLQRLDELLRLLD
ncbi:HAD family hydrolase [Neptuniibacter halophilus]|uniref:HAD family hydrolase n=1 Tax=Neptuniibacter halophilus TaxID=651666 RepID=UPI002573996A|nr:HAD-IA family hydrolase [Neptuniibacter halophilus]